MMKKTLFLAVALFASVALASEIWEEIEVLEKLRPAYCCCPKIYAPVCSTKGVTYANKCYAQCQNEEVRSSWHIEAS